MLTRQPSSTGPVLEPGAVIGQRYKVDRALGAGTYAQVYRARDLEVTDHTVALKISKQPAADDQEVRDALRELQLIASVFHPSVVQLKDHGWHEGHLWFVMPLYRGETLATRLRRGPLTRRAARELFEALAEALATMHRAGVRHQDIKPDNIFLAQLDPQSERRLPVLLDLGLGVKDTELVLAGTPWYLAPEVAAHFAGVPDPPPIGPKADVFALALTLRHALDPDPNGDPTGCDVVAFVAARARVAPAPPDGRDLRDLRGPFERWLNLSPDMRPNAEELRRELACLTRREEQRARRVSLARWLLPTALAIISLFATTTYVLSHEAKLQRLEAHSERLRAAQAQARAQTMRTSLEVEQDKRRVLEEESRTSRLTRDELTQRLAATEEELARRLKVAEELAAELCQRRGGKDCGELRTPLIAVDPSRPELRPPE